MSARVARFATVGAFTSVLTIASVAHATETSAAASASSPPRFVIGAEPAAGVGTPLGWLGGSMSFRPVDFLAMHAGVGLGSQGVQIAAGARVAVLRLASSRAWIGAGWSSGAFAQVGSNAGFPSLSTDADVWYWPRAHFANLEIGLEHPLSDRLSLRPFVGIAAMLNRNDGICGSRYACSDPRGPWAVPMVPYAGMALSFGVL